MYSWYLNSLSMTDKDDVEREMNGGELTYITNSMHKELRDVVMHSLFESKMFVEYRTIRDYCLEHGPTYTNEDELHD